MSLPMSVCSLWHQRERTSVMTWYSCWLVGYVSVSCPVVAVGICICVGGGGGVCLGESCLFVGCLTSQGRICSDNCMCCHTEIEAANQTFHLTQSQYTVTGPPSTDSIMQGAWQGSHWGANFVSHIFRS